MVLKSITSSFKRFSLLNNQFGTDNNAASSPASIQKRGNVGLVNIGNTCFMNGVLQNLIAIPTLSEYFLSRHYLQDLRPDNKNVASTFAEVMSSVVEAPMIPDQEKAYNISSFKKALGDATSVFVTGRQEDAHEFLRILLDSLHNDLNRVTEKPPYMELNYNKFKSPLENSQHWWNYTHARENSIITDVFEGQLMNTLTCQNCHNQSISFENFQDLAIPLDTANNTLEVLLRNFFSHEMLEDPVSCDNCKTKSKAVKKYNPTVLPETLVIQLKRFDAESKLNTVVDIPEVLIMNQWNRPCRYILNGMVHHYGYVDFGHYTADCRNPFDGKWYHFDDQTISLTETDIHEKMRIQSDSAYLLFYTAR